jgi:glycosyltransferase involved in cell wall biosynthesis
MAATVHDVTFCTRPEEFSDETRRYYLDITADAGARACAIVCDSLHTKHELQRYFRVERARVRVVSPCIPSTFRPADIAKLVRVRRDYTLPDRFFLHVPGGWIPRKNTMRLLEAYHQLRTEEGSTCPDLVIVSPAPFVLPALKARIPEMVRLIDYVSDEDLPAVMSGAVAMVYPSLEEGFGLPVAEALACGVTVVIADRPVFREVAGPQAIYVDPENPTSIAAGLKQAASETRDVMRVAARIARAARFRPERSAARMLAVFRRCLRDSID